MRYVIDASIAVEYLLRTELGLRAAEIIERSDVLAPELLDAEVLSVLRRLASSKAVTEKRARTALEDLAVWPLERVRHAELLLAAWEFRHNLSAYDALYVAAARLFDAVLLTSDGPLANARGLGIPVTNLRVR